MEKKTRQTGKSTMLSAILTGTATSTAAALMGAGITAWLIASGKAGQNGTDTAAWIILFLSSAAGTWIAARRTGRKKLQTALITGGAFLLILLMLTAALFEGHYNKVWFGTILTMGASLATAMMSLKQRKAGKQKQWKKAYR